MILKSWRDHELFVSDALVERHLLAIDDPTTSASSLCVCVCGGGGPAVLQASWIFIVVSIIFEVMEVRAKHLKRQLVDQHCCAHPHFWGATRRNHEQFWRIANTAILSRGFVIVESLQRLYMLLGHSPCNTVVLLFVSDVLKHSRITLAFGRLQTPRCYHVSFLTCKGTINTAEISNVLWYLCVHRFCGSGGATHAFWIRGCYLFTYNCMYTLL